MRIDQNQGSLLASKSAGRGTCSSKHFRVQIAGQLAATIPFLLYVVLLLWTIPARALDVAAWDADAKQFFAGADRVGEVSGVPPSAPVYAGHTLLGYVFLSKDIVQLPGYSGQPINTLIGLDMNGKITGVEIVQHQEPILLAGVSERELHRYVDQYRGKSAYARIRVGGDGSDGYVGVDAISGATITSMVESATVMRAAYEVAMARHLHGPVVVSKGHTPSRHANAPVGSADKQSFAPLAATQKQSLMPAVLGDKTEPMWAMVWRAHMWRIGVLSTGLFFLMLVLVFQDWLARRPALLRYIRRGYLLFTLFFIGWYGLAQLSIVNVLTFVNAMMNEFKWDTFLIDPMMFILWSFVAVTLLLWGRGVYCGWLCPFGALQEFTQKIAHRLRIPQLEFPEVVHERLWAMKYLVLLALFGISLESLGAAERYAEVEPFKTAIILRFHRDWAYVLFALAITLMSLINRKFYCKYLCPLAAALTIPARFRVFDWLRRHKECGQPCQICANECEVRAVRTTGEINPNECHHCLDCQVTYWNDYKCPPQVQRRKRRERGPRARELARGMESTVGKSGLDEIGVRVDHGKER